MICTFPQRVCKILKLFTERHANSFSQKMFMNIQSSVELLLYVYQVEEKVPPDLFALFRSSLKTADFKLINYIDSDSALDKLYTSLEK